MDKKEQEETLLSDRVSIPCPFTLEEISFLSKMVTLDRTKEGDLYLKEVVGDVKTFRGEVEYFIGKIKTFVGLIDIWQNLRKETQRSWWCRRNSPKISKPTLYSSNSPWNKDDNQGDA